MGIRAGASLVAAMPTANLPFRVARQADLMAATMQDRVCLPHKPGASRKREQ
jgi:hypothetical protein